MLTDMLKRKIKLLKNNNESKKHEKQNNWNENKNNLKNKWINNQKIWEKLNKSFNPEE